MKELNFFGHLGQNSADFVVETDLDLAGFGVSVYEVLVALRMVHLMGVKVLVPLFGQVPYQLLLSQASLLAVAYSFHLCLCLDSVVFH